ncbi:MAG TPA: CoA transferase [Acetobacteraceae bacterium]|jgi:crotonobetainyl-CoA:carnitine CoA-transferase CaiB-like acyl-CoA transferase|nr:CoA transferase [Acetobacteraceae bacterium]
MSLLNGFRVVQIGDGRAAAVCGRLLADVGAAVMRVDASHATPLQAYLNHGHAERRDFDLAAADLIVCEGRPAELRARNCDADALRRRNPDATLVFISPFGQTGPQADDPASDLTLFYASGIARMLTGQVDDLAEAPIRPAGEQSAFIGGIAAACAGMHAALMPAPGAIIDVSIEEALATLAMTELASAGLHGRSRSRKRLTDGNGATVCILPARDGYAAISPREDRQWAAWLEAMGSPAWGSDPRFATKPDRVANWDALHALMSDWSRQHDKQWIADTAQAARVPSFPLRELTEQLVSPQLAHRRFYRPIQLGGRTVQAPGPPFGLSMTQSGRSPAPCGELPLSGIRVLDFSWVIAGPTTTRYLAAMGAEVIKVEAPGRGDPGRASELHTVLGQAKRGVVLDLKQPQAVDVARALADRCDVLVENFATGVMDRLGLGAAALQQRNPDLLYVSASGLGRTGPESHAVAYGTLLQCYAGFAGLNRHPDIPPRVGFAWLDPMCGLMLAFVVAAGIWQRQRSGGVARIDFSMIEAMLWTLAEPLMATQCDAPPQPQGNRSRDHVPHGAWRCAGDDEWISVAVTGDEQWRSLCGTVAALSPMAGLGLPERIAQRGAIEAALAGWLRLQNAAAAAASLRDAGVPAAPLADSMDLVASRHLRARGFWEPHGTGVLPGLPWRASFGRRSGAAPGLGADTDTVLADVLGMSRDDIAALRGPGALG